MSRIGAILLGVTTLVFIASSVTFALRLAGPEPATAPMPYNEMASLLSPQPFYQRDALRVSLSEMFLRPQDAGMLGLLVMTWAALAYHALRHLIEIWHPAIRGPAPLAGGIRSLPRRDPNSGRRADAALILGLGLGAIWPWLAPGHPTAALMLSAAMLACFLGAALQRVRGSARPEHSSTLGFAAGWALLACLSVLAVVMQDRLGLPQGAGAVAAVLIAALVTVSVQLRLGRRIGLSVAVLWGLIGIAAGTVTQDAAIATATVLAISIIVVALVRVTT